MGKARSDLGVVERGMSDHPTYLSLRRRLLALQEAAEQARLALQELDRGLAEMIEEEKNAYSIDKSLE